MCLLDEWTQVFWPKQEENFFDSRTDIQVSISTENVVTQGLKQNKTN